MLFNSLDYIIFLPVVVIVYYAVPDRIKHIWLLIASYYFYMCWNAGYALLILFSTAVTYLSGLLLEREKSRTDADSSRKAVRKKLIVAAGFLLNLGMLCFFKYTGLLLESLKSILALFRITLHVPEFDILLPVGISFFTFQALGYMMDVYRGETYAERDFFRYALFVSFFPQLVAGPIERSKNLLKQLAVPRRFSFARAKEGLLLMLWGFFLKIVIADRAAMLVDAVYGDVSAYGGWYYLIATLVFAVQIYCDFSGYSIIAMGTAKMLGIQLMDNFDAPYFSCSVAEFWRKWHISLTSWFKDYLYIPLGGSRKGKIRKYVNQMIVFLVSGLWHGASFTFVIWGAINGLFQIVGEITNPVRERLAGFFHMHRDSAAHRFVSGIITFFLIDFSWIFFRAGSLDDAARIIKGILSPGSPVAFLQSVLQKANAGTVPGEHGLEALVLDVALVCFCIILLAFADWKKHRGVVLRERIMAQDTWFQSLVIVVAVCCILLFGIWGPGYSQSAFIYFQF